MSRGARRLTVAVALAVLPACSLAFDLSGYSEPETPDATSPDAMSLSDAMRADTSVMVIPDATPPPCTPTVTIDTTLTSSFGSWKPQAKNANGYPKIESFFGTPAAVLLPFIDTTPMPIDAGPDADGGFKVASELGDAISGLWWSTVVPLVSFDVSFEMYVKCTNGASCADGLAFAWAGTQDRSTLTNMNFGGPQGFPSKVPGGMVLADTYQNNDSDESGDPATPALEIVKVDGVGEPGMYHWVASSKSFSFLNKWVALAISVRGTTTSVSYDGSPTLMATIPSVKTGLVGLSAATGGESDAVAVRNVKASFYACAP